MTKIFTTEHRTKLEQYLAEHELPSGLGSEQSSKKEAPNETH